jgi:hypothetical protein
MVKLRGPIQALSLMMTRYSQSRHAESWFVQEARINAHICRAFTIMTWQLELGQPALEKPTLQ